MLNIVQSYLTRYYEIGTSEVGNDGIYSLTDTRKHRAPIYGDRLIEELVTIFCYSEELIKDYIVGWAVSIKSDINLDFYWATEPDIFGMPLVQRVESRTLGMDLVPVQPMEGPNPVLMYHDYIYSADTQTKPKKKPKRRGNSLGWLSAIQTYYNNRNEI